MVVDKHSEISSEEARSYQFSGTEHSYDGAEVERFRQRVIDTLAAHEAMAPPTFDGKQSQPRTHSDGDDLAAAQRARQQAVQLAERMLRDVMGASADGSSGLDTWQEAAMLRAVAEEEMAFAREEARRLPAVAAAERDEMRAKYAEERTAVRRELQNELLASRSAAEADAAEIRGAAEAEASEILARAIDQSNATQQEAADQIRRMEGRMGVLKTALADAEGRFRRLAATAANELGTLSAITDLDLVEIAATAEPELQIAEVDLRDSAPEDEAPPEDHPQEGFVKMDPEAGFYQRRLAGLRDRLEKSGHPPE